MKLYAFNIQRSSFDHSTGLDRMWSFLDFDQWTRNKNSIKKSELIELNILNLLLALWQVPLGNQVLGIKVPKLGFWIGMAMEYY